ncbi:MAG: DUF2683 family protein [Nanoarchaeota archaeon]|nr:DUF2683 family protein [Nanoarchaeota archaeon]MBU1270020.1 DUF2683 family protein [Nanoarchaeota archaeon]MBU1604556.1 DUF2683 family protein [Nanoarchaeota archaeon]MBU2443624.1 DUF2683 family protein [Nanoarchaeota archaeon]
MTRTISFRAEIDDYTNRVLGVIKEKFGLKDKTQALNLFAKMYGDDFVEKETQKEFIEEVTTIVQEHHKKHSKRRMNLKELDELTGFHNV